MINGNDKYEVFLNSVTHRKLVHLNIRTEVKVRVTNEAVEVSFHKQNCAVFSEEIKAHNFSQLTEILDLCRK